MTTAYYAYDAHFYVLDLMRPWKSMLKQMHSSNNIVPSKIGFDTRLFVAFFMVIVLQICFFPLCIRLTCTVHVQYIHAQAGQDSVVPSFEGYQDCYRMQDQSLVQNGKHMLHLQRKRRPKGAGARGVHSWRVSSVISLRIMKAALSDHEKDRECERVALVC